MKYLLAVALLLSANAFAGEQSCATCGQPYTIDAIEADQVYVSGGPNEVDTTTKTMVIPAGMKMVEIDQPDKIVCTAYPQPSIWNMVPIVKRRYIPPVTADHMKQLQEILK